jgi:tripartite-type tricarboxylate transporter receptor subunit TctC
MSPTIVSAVSLIALTLSSFGTASAQRYPTKPIRIVTSDAGGGADVSLRVVAPLVSQSLGQQVIVDNRGGGVIAGELVAHAPPDGYTLLYYGNTVWMIPLLRKTPPFNVDRDFTPVTLATSSPSVLVVHPSLAAKSVKELIALAKARPGVINYASASTGTANHLAAELFKSMAGVNMTRIPYKGNGQAVNAVVAGEAQVMFPAAGSVGGQIKAGRLRALAVTGAKRSVAYPDLPTVAEAGVPGYEAVSNIGLFAPAKTPQSVIMTINHEFASALRRSEVSERFLSIGVEPVGSTPAEFAQAYHGEVRRMAKVIKDAGIEEN